MSRALLPLRALALLLLALLAGPEGRLRPLEAKDPAPPPESARHLVLLVLGGGVRATDALDPTRMPSVAALADEGVKAQQVASRRPSALLALRDLLTGRDDEAEVPGRPRTTWPTLFECVRATGGVRGEQVWFVDAGAAAEPGLEASTHPAYGATLGARTAHGDGSFGEPLKGFLEQMGRPLPVPEQVWPLLRRLREVNRRAVGVFLPADVDSGTLESERVERAVLAEIDRKALFIKAPYVGDEKALRAALTILAVHRPRVLVLRLTGAEAAQQSMGAYEDALRQGDEALARLRAAVAKDPILATTTAVAVATEMGRNAKPDPSGGLGASDDSPARRQALLTVAGPGWRKGAQPKGGGRLSEVAPTLARWLGVTMPHATGRVWEECLAR